MMNELHGEMKRALVGACTSIMISTYKKHRNEIFIKCPILGCVCQTTLHLVRGARGLQAQYSPPKGVGL